jgi:hypothetical protein
MSYSGTTPQFTSVKAGNIELDGDTVYYGDKEADGSFRITKDGADLKIQVRQVGVWVDRDIIDTGSGVTPPPPPPVGAVSLTENTPDINGLLALPINEEFDSKGQTFQLANNATVSEIVFALELGSTPWTGGVIVEIYDDDTETTLLGTSDVVDNSLIIPFSMTEVPFAFSSPVALLGGVSYYAKITYFNTFGIDPFADAGVKVGSNSLDDYMDGTGYDNGVDDLFDYYFIIKGN